MHQLSLPEPVICPRNSALLAQPRRVLLFHFSILTRQAIFTSVADLTTAIEAYIDNWNQGSHPFTWTKTADELLAKARTPRQNKRPYRPLAMMYSDVTVSHAPIL